MIVDWAIGASKTADYTFLGHFCPLWPLITFLTSRLTKLLKSALDSVPGADVSQQKSLYYVSQQKSYRPY